MKRIVLDCLPFEDPTNEARRIVRRGMADVIQGFSDEAYGNWQRTSPPLHWGHPFTEHDGLPQVDMLVDYGRGITFCSKAVDAEARFFERGFQELRMEFRLNAINTEALQLLWGGPIA